jgi:hypothetical protein
MSPREFHLPESVTVKSVAAGRSRARRWELYRGPAVFENYLGDLVHWLLEQEWEWQPADYRDERVSGPTPEGAVVEAVAAAASV